MREEELKNFHGDFTAFYIPQFFIEDNEARLIFSNYRIGHDSLVGGRPKRCYSDYYRHGPEPYRTQIERLGKYIKM